MQRRLRQTDLKDAHPPRSGRPSAAFSLVEVCMAIGLVSFCLVALLVLFQAGFAQERQAIDQVRAASILGALSDEFRGLTRHPQGIGNMSTEGSRFGLKLPLPGDPAVEPPAPLKLGEQGIPDTDSPAYVVQYSITPPSLQQGSYAPYRLRAVIAWPASASISSTSASPRIAEARGFLETMVEANRE